MINTQWQQCNHISTNNHRSNSLQMTANCQRPCNITCWGGGGVLVWTVSVIVSLEVPGTSAIAANVSQLTLVRSFELLLTLPRVLLSENKNTPHYLLWTVRVSRTTIATVPSHVLGASRQLCCMGWLFMRLICCWSDSVHRRTTSVLNECVS